MAFTKESDSSSGVPAHTAGRRGVRPDAVLRNLDPRKLASGLAGVIRWMYLVRSLLSPLLADLPLILKRGHQVLESVHAVGISERIAHCLLRIHLLELHLRDHSVGLDDAAAQLEPLRREVGKLRRRRQDWRKSGELGTAFARIRVPGPNGLEPRECPFAATAEALYLYVRSVRNPPSDDAATAMLRFQCALSDMGARIKLTRRLYEEAEWLCSRQPLIDQRQSADRDQPKGINL